MSLDEAGIVITNKMTENIKEEVGVDRVKESERIIERKEIMREMIGKPLHHPTMVTVEDFECYHSVSGDLHFY